jgi:hypothetical protein
MGLSLMMVSEGRKVLYFLANFLKQIINGHVLEVDLLCMINVGSVSKNAD